MSAATRRGALQFSVAALFAGTAASAVAVAPPGITETPIGTLHRQFREIAARRAEMDKALVELQDGPEYDAMKEVFYQVLADGLALQARMLALQAQNLEDAAIQVTICYYLTEAMDPDPTEDEVAELSQQMRTALASVLLAVGKARGMDIDHLGWGDMNRLCRAHGPAGSAVA